MRNLVSKIQALRKGAVGRLVRQRMSEFKAAGEGADSLFSELCFCIMTANFQAEKSIRIQTSLCDSFHKLGREELAAQLRKHGHRFPNTRAGYIYEARKQHSLLRDTFAACKDEPEMRDWLVKNVKGLGMKEASHFLRNIGCENLAIIDFHIIDILADNALIEKPKNKSLSRKRYLEIEAVLGRLARKAKVSQAELDLYLWYMETGKVLK